ncbi:MAG: hypothetical protein ACKONH_02710, partial [Planctomycetia bacterium]
MVAAFCGCSARPSLRPHAGPAPRRRYERRRPEKTPLHKAISENLASWLEWRDEAKRPVPGYVEEELRGCGAFRETRSGRPGRSSRGSRVA